MSGLCQFAAKLADGGVQAASIKCYFSALRQLQVTRGLGDPEIGKMVKQILQGIKAVQARGPGKGAARLPVTPSLLLAIKSSWEKEACTYNRAMVWAAALLCFLGFLCLGEVCVPSDTEFDEGAHLTFNDVEIVSIQDMAGLHGAPRKRSGSPIQVSGWETSDQAKICGRISSSSGNGRYRPQTILFWTQF